MNNITDLLDLEDSDIKISDIIIEGQTKTLIIETPPVASYCPICGFRMHSHDNARDLPAINIYDSHPAY